MQVNINEYKQNQFEEEFRKSLIFKKLSIDFDYISFFNHFNTYEEEFLHQVTPRHRIGVSSFSAVPFYYLNYLTKKLPVSITDLGCGWNIFKKYIPNIFGIGAEDTDSQFYFGDEWDYVDEDYIKQHQNFFKSVFSINSLHFIPITSIRKRVIDFNSMIAPEGSGFLTMNAMRLIERSSNVDIKNIESYIRKELDIENIKYDVFDVDLTYLDNPIDGNIRMVISK